MTEKVYSVFLTVLLFTSGSQSDDQEEEIDMYHASAGQFFQLICDSDAESNMSWSKDNQYLDLTTSQIKTVGDSLLFLPVEISDSGYYTCNSSDSSENGAMKMHLLVGDSLCPPHSDIKSVQQGSNDKLICGQEDIFTLSQTAEISWLKDCNPLDFHDEKIRLSNVTSSDAGNYTCVMKFFYEGRNFTASRTILLSVKDEPFLVHPRVIHPRNETIKVKPGAKAELNCTVFVGMGENTEFEKTFVYWTVNGSFFEEYKQLSHSLNRERKETNLVSTLSISEVRPEFFHVPFRCVVYNSVHRDVGVVLLTPENHIQTDFHINLTLCMAFPVVIVGVVIYHLFKVDMVLAFRRLCPSLACKKGADGKVYDAYVSYLHCEALCQSRLEEFCLQVLPAVLEQQYGYKLFIRGRDDLPGEAIQNVISKAISRSRRFIIVLSAWNWSEQGSEDPVLWEQNQDWPVFEQQIGLHDGLIKNSLKVILVETEKNIDYSLLPQSVQYVKQQQGALRWTPTRGDPIAPPNRRFWKYLRYCMPPSSPMSSHPEQDTWEMLNNHLL